jgi:hypothetical protein
VIRNENISWVREFLTDLCEKDADKAEVKVIVESLRKLWRVAKAAEQNPYPRSPRLQEALDSIRKPEQGSPPGAQSL